MKFTRLCIAAALALGICAGAQAQQKYEMKLAYFVGDQHAMSQWLVKWSEQLEKGSGGRIAVKRFPGAQMGPTPNHYDFARTGQADAAWFLHGGTPGRFPLTEIVSLPFMVGSAEIGIKVLNDAELRAKYLDAEHKGVKVLMLFTHQPGGVHTTKKPVRTLDDMKGMRIRFSNPTIRELVAALGVPGKKALIDGGMEPIKLSAADSAKVRSVGGQGSEATIRGYEEKGLPARTVYNMMRALSEKHAKTSKNFWN